MQLGNPIKLPSAPTCSCVEVYAQRDANSQSFCVLGSSRRCPCPIGSVYRGIFLRYPVRDEEEWLQEKQLREVPGCTDGAYRLLSVAGRVQVDAAVKLTGWLAQRFEGGSDTAYNIKGMTGAVIMGRPAPCEQRRGVTDLKGNKT